MIEEISITREAFMSLVNLEAEKLAGYSITAYGPKFIPIRPRGVAAQVVMGAGLVYEVKVGAKRHNVVVARVLGTDRFMYWCGDAYLEGTAKDKGSGAAAVVWASEQGYSMAGHPVAVCGEFAPSTACNFYRNNMMCKHMRGVFDSLKSDPAAIASIDALIDSLGGPAGAAPVAKPNAVSDKLSRYAFRFNVMLAGPKGWGKSVLVDQFCAKAGCEEVVFLGGHEGIESMDLTGHMIRLADGSFGWKDGRLSEAFRSASAGVRTVLVIDEILRIRKRELSVLVAALAPGADGRLRLSTGRAIDVCGGVAHEEILTCDRSNLWVITTTNLGSRYEVDGLEEALSDRFPIILHMKGSEDDLRAKLTEAAAARGKTPDLVEALVTLWKTLQKMIKQGLLTREVNLRHMAEILSMADSPRDLAELAEDRIPLWTEVDSDGELIAGQVDAVKKAIAASLKGAA